MPKLPSAQSFGSRPTPRSSRGVVSADGTAIGRAQQVAGKQMQQTGADLEKKSAVMKRDREIEERRLAVEVKEQKRARDRLDLARLKADHSTKSLELADQVAAHPDYTQRTALYEAGNEKIMEDLSAGGNYDPMVMEEFGIYNQASSAVGAHNVRVGVRASQKAADTIYSSEQINKKQEQITREQVRLANLPDDYEGPDRNFALNELISQTEELFDTAYETGLIPSEAARDQKEQEFLEFNGMAFYNAQSTEEQVRISGLRTQGELSGTAADSIPQSSWEKMHDAALIDLQNKAINTQRAELAQQRAVYPDVASKIDTGEITNEEISELVNKPETRILGEHAANNRSLFEKQRLKSEYDRLPDSVKQDSQLNWDTKWYNLVSATTPANLAKGKLKSPDDVDGPIIDEVIKFYNGVLEDKTFDPAKKNRYLAKLGPVINKMQVNGSFFGSSSFKKSAYIDGYERVLDKVEMYNGPNKAKHTNMLFGKIIEISDSIKFDNGIGGQSLINDISDPVAESKALDMMMDLAIRSHNQQNHPSLAGVENPPSDIIEIIPEDDLSGEWSGYGIEE